MRYVHREGPIAAGDTRTAIVTQGANTMGTILVEPGESKITQIIAGVGDNTSTGVSGGQNFFVTLSGTGMRYGDQVIPIGAASAYLATAGDTGHGCRVFGLHNVDIDVVPGGSINIYVEATLGVLLGLPEFGVTLGFA
jgi:hypothetical protein